MRGNKNSLKHDLRVRSLEGVSDDDTRRSYKRSTDDFAAWAKEQGYKNIENISTEVIQTYEEHLEESPKQYTAATIHTKLAPVCKACGIRMDEIRKPKRTSSHIKRGREARTRSEREATKDKYARVVDLQRVVGIRRAELARLEGRDWDGHYIHVRGGKGGKDTMQFVLPKDRHIVNDVFAEVESSERVFSKEEMNNHINLHSMRAAHARDCYEFYNNIIKDNPQAAEQFRRVLMHRWKAGNVGLLSDEKKYERYKKRFERDIDNDSPYILRGENKKKAIAQNRPTEYNRLALMCVSVFHLSHWRLDVTVTNYLLA